MKPMCSWLVFGLKTITFSYCIASNKFLATNLIQSSTCQWNSVKCRNVLYFMLQFLFIKCYFPYHNFTNLNSLNLPICWRRGISHENWWCCRINANLYQNPNTYKFIQISRNVFYDEKRKRKNLFRSHHLYNFVWGNCQYIRSICLLYKFVWTIELSSIVMLKLHSNRTHTYESDIP